MYLRNATLVLTYACNNRCNFCYAAKYLTDSFMSQETFNRCLELIKANNIKKRVALTGGEPTVHPNFLEFIRKLSKNGVSVYLYTNGRKFKDKNLVEKVCRAGVNVISVSFQAPTPQEAEKIQGSKEAYYEAIEAIENLSKYKDKMIIALMVVLGTVDLDFYTRVFKKVKELGFRGFGINTNNGTLTNDGVIQHDDLARFLIQVRDVLRKLGLTMGILPKMPLCLLPEKILREMLNRDEIRWDSINTCRASSDHHITFEPDGSIIPCVYWTRTGIGHINDFFVNGNFSQKKFAKFWETGGAKDFRRKAFVYRSKKCQKCKLFPQKCVGGCMLSYIGKDKKYMDKMIPGWKKSSLFYS